MMHIPAGAWIFAMIFLTISTVINFIKVMVDADYQPLDILSLLAALISLVLLAATSIEVYE